jgi:hypothetical protein
LRDRALGNSAPHYLMAVNEIGVCGHRRVRERKVIV